MIQNYIVFFSLILSGFSQELQLDYCRNCFGELTVEYTCTSDGTILQWILLPVIITTTGSQSARFSTNSDVGDTIPVGNTLATLDSRFPLISRLRITSDPSLQTGDVVCRSDGVDNVTAYVRNTYVPTLPASLLITDDTINSSCVTLNMMPQERTDVDYFSITNSQNDAVMEVKPTQRSVTICLNPGNITFSIAAIYECPYTGPIQSYCVEVLPTTPAPTIPPSSPPPTSPPNPPSWYWIILVVCFCIGLALGILGTFLSMKAYYGGWCKTSHEKDQENLQQGVELQDKKRRD